NRSGPPAASTTGRGAPVDSNPAPPGAAWNTPDEPRVATEVDRSVAFAVGPVASSTFAKNSSGDVPVLVTRRACCADWWIGTVTCTESASVVIFSEGGAFPDIV